MLRRCLDVTLLLALALPLQAAQPQFWSLESARDFQEGDTVSLSIDSQGRVRLAPEASRVFDPEAPYVWSLARANDGVLYAGTGNDGKIFRVDNGAGRVLFDAPELEVHALAVGPDGRVYAGTSPDGKVYAIDRTGAATTFYDPTDRYIWALEFDRGGDLIVATGAEGKVVRVDKKGNPRVLLSTPETHVTALAVDPSGVIYAGSAPGGIVYRIEGEAVSVLHDSSFREVKALAVGAGGVYAALVDAKGPADTAPVVNTQTTVAPTTAAAPAGEVTVSESFTIVAPPAGLSVAPAITAARAPRGAVVRIRAAGEVETLWSSPDETPFALAAIAGGVVVGTGNKGRVYEVHDDTSWTMISDVPAEQVTALVRDRKGDVVISTSNPGRLHGLGAGAARTGTFTSKVKDTEALSGWGRVRWEAATPPGTQVTLQTRSGNTGAPDTTWTAWSQPYTAAAGQPIAHPPGRFLQVRATLSGPGTATPVLESVTAAYLQRNLRPDVTGITVHPAGEVFQKPLSVSGDADILGLDQPAPTPPTSPAAAPSPRTQAAPVAYARKMYQRGLQTFSWKAEDPNGDTLGYEVSYRSLGEDRLHLLRSGLTEPVVTWDTTAIPNGRYVVRVTASDAPSNPRALALTAFDESAPFDVDNTPPSVEVSSTGGAHVRAVARDAFGHIRRAEYSVDGGPWQQVFPADGIDDGPEETYDFDVAAVGAGPHVVMVRASDQQGNVGSGRAPIP